MFCFLFLFHFQYNIDKLDNTLGLSDDVDAIALEVFNELNRLSEAEKRQDIKSEQQADWNKCKLFFLCSNF